MTTTSPRLRLDRNDWWKLAKSLLLCAVASAGITLGTLLGDVDWSALGTWAPVAGAASTFVANLLIKGLSNGTTRS